MVTQLPNSARATITELDIWPVQQPGDKSTFVVIRLSTDAGVSGWGESMSGADMTSATDNLSACRPLLIGEDALRREYIRKMLAQRANDGSQAALDMALVDILGKLTQSPAHGVFGGPTRAKARAIALLTGDSESKLLASLSRSMQAGFRAASVPILLPAGPTRGRQFYRQTRELLDRMRDIAGDGMDFVLDCGATTTPAEAGVLASSLEDFHLLWLDEPTGKIHEQGLSTIAAEHATPIGWGRSATANGEFQNLLTQDAVDVLRPGITRLGMTQIRKAAAIAETYYVAVAPYNRGGPIGTAAALHVAAAIPNFFALEIPFPIEEADRRMRVGIGGEVESVTEGYCALPKGPGLGITVNVEVLEEYSIRS